MDWFRFYTDTVYDRKLRRLPPAQRWLWVAVLTVARQSPEPGKLLLSERNGDETFHVTGDETEGNIVVTEEDLSDIAKVDIKEVEQGIRAFQRQRMLHVEDGIYVVTHWQKRQYVSDSSTERVRNHRNKMKRYSNVPETPPDTDTETDTDIYKDPVVGEIITAFEQTFGRLPNGVQIDELDAFAKKGMEAAIILQAMRKTRQMDKPISYLFGILRNMLDSGILTMTEAQAEQSRRQTTTTNQSSRPGSKGVGQRDERYAAFYELFPDA